MLPPSSRPEVSGPGVQEVEGGGGESKLVDLGLLEGDVQHVVPYARRLQRATTMVIRMWLINSAPVFRHLAPGINKMCT